MNGLTKEEATALYVEAKCDSEMECSQCEVEEICDAMGGQNRHLSSALDKLRNYINPCEAGREGTE